VVMDGGGCGVDDKESGCVYLVAGFC